MGVIRLLLNAQSVTTLNKHYATYRQNLPRGQLSENLSSTFLPTLKKLETNQVGKLVQRRQNISTKWLLAPSFRNRK